MISHQVDIFSTCFSGHAGQLRLLKILCSHLSQSRMESLLFVDFLRKEGILCFTSAGFGNPTKCRREVLRSLINNFFLFSARHSKLSPNLSTLKGVTRGGLLMTFESFSVQNRIHAIVLAGLISFSLLLTACEQMKQNP